MKMPLKIEDPSDYRPGTKIAKIIEKKIWLVEITMPKNLMNDIRTGSVELEGQDIDFDELDDAYSEDLGQDEFQTDNEQQPAQPVQPPTM
jgi:hypothetical protein